MAVRVPVNMTLPKELVEQLDEFVGPRGRSAYVEELLEKQLRREQTRRIWQRAAGILNAEDYPEWSTSEKVQEWVRERRREETTKLGE